ncbi:MAG: hypothetical protein V5A43_04340 [Haloarculaceae archaeon]
MATSKQPAWISFKGVPFDSDRFTMAWVLALATYGVGDVVTTIELVWFSPMHFEGNPVIAGAISMFGVGGFLGLKLLVFYAAIGVSVWAGVQAHDRLMVYGPPMVLAVFGLLVSAINIWHVLHVE